MCLISGSYPADQCTRGRITYARLGPGLVFDDESSSATDAHPAQFRKAGEGPRQLAISGKQGPGKADREEEKNRAKRRAG